jgi:hypothetical protein
VGLLYPLTAGPSGRKTRFGILLPRQDGFVGSRGFANPETLRLLGIGSWNFPFQLTNIKQRNFEESNPHNGEPQNFEGWFRFAQSFLK